MRTFDLELRYLESIKVKAHRIFVDHGCLILQDENVTNFAIYAPGEWESIFELKGDPDESHPT